MCFRICFLSCCIFKEYPQIRMYVWIYLKIFAFFSWRSQASIINGLLKLKRTVCILTSFLIVSDPGVWDCHYTDRARWKKDGKAYSGFWLHLQFWSRRAESTSEVGDGADVLKLPDGEMNSDTTKRWPPGVQNVLSCVQWYWFPSTFNLNETYWLLCIKTGGKQKEKEIGCWDVGSSKFTIESPIFPLGLLPQCVVMEINSDILVEIRNSKRDRSSHEMLYRDVGPV